MNIEVHIEWQERKTGRQLGIRAAVLDLYASAFEHPLMDETRQCLGIRPR